MKFCLSIHLLIIHCAFLISNAEDSNRDYKVQVKSLHNHTLVTCRCKRPDDVFHIDADSPVLRTKHSLEISHCGEIVFYDSYNADLENLDIRFAHKLKIHSKALRKIGKVKFEHIERVEMEPNSFDDIIATEVLFNNVTFAPLFFNWKQLIFNPGWRSSIRSLIFENSYFDQEQHGAILTSSEVQTVIFRKCVWRLLPNNSMRINATSLVMIDNIFNNESVNPFFIVESPAITLIHNHTQVVTTSFERRVGLGDRFNQTYRHTTHLPVNVEHYAMWLNTFNFIVEEQSPKVTEPTYCSCHWLRANSNSWTQSITCSIGRLIKESVIYNGDWQNEHCIVTASPSAHQQTNNANGIGFSFLHLSVFILIHRLVLE